MFLIAVAIAIPAAAWADPTPDPECMGKAEGDECRAATTCSSAVYCDRNLHCNNGANPINNNEPCESDNDACTVDRCDGGTCHHHQPVNCDDSNACTVDGCDQQAGCQHTDVVCDDGNPCTVNSCNPAVGCDFNTHVTDDCTPSQCGTSDCGNDCGPCSLPCVPVITCPAAKSVECVDGAGANTLGTATATCDAEITNDGQDSYDFTCDAGNSHDVTYTATNADGSDTCTATLTIEDTAKPSATCDPDVTVKTSDTMNPALTGPCEATITPAASGTDDCEGPLTGTCDPEELTQNGPDTTSSTCTVADCSENSASCIQKLTLIDDTPPVITCATPYVTPPLAPMSWTAASDVTDNCGGATSAHVTSVDCYLINGAGKKVSKLAACKASYSGNTVSVGPSAGGVNTIIQWTMSATDGSGNMSTATCMTQVQNPGLTR